MAYRFTCQPNCSNCCQMEGEVYLSEEDLARVAAFVGVSPMQFVERHAVREERLLRLRKPADKQCQFHNDNRCSIHPAKPTQCRIFPFWPELIEDAAVWDETSKYCPGLNQGELVQIEAAQALGREMVTAYPAMYGQ